MGGPRQTQPGVQEAKGKCIPFFTETLLCSNTSNKLPNQAVHLLSLLQHLCCTTSPTESLQSKYLALCPDLNWRMLAKDLNGTGLELHLGSL